MKLTRKKYWRGILCVTALIFSSAPLFSLDAEFEKLKSAASIPAASLSVRTVTNRAVYAVYEQTFFEIDTGARKYKLRYTSFLGAYAFLNPKYLNDGCSGYGMLSPFPNWYQNGFIGVALDGAGGPNISTIQAKVRILADKGPCVAYDLVFTGENGTIVVRTAALAGREELFVSVFGWLEQGSIKGITTWFYGFPLGFKGPFDRWVHADGQDIRNAGKERKAFPLAGQGKSWLLLADHQADSDGKEGGLLGLIFDKSAISRAEAVHCSNYGITITFVGDAGKEQRFIVYTFDAMKWETARARIAQENNSVELLDQVFRDLPHPRKKDK
ncbi:MAG: hypothetical protein Q7J98_13740 [Kiritimatiellia bacterium]|nr:hypothetical protein [Kiritimatiellia bacterium]